MAIPDPGGKQSTPDALAHADNGKPGADRDLVEFLNQDVLPRLRAEDIFTHSAHDFQQDGRKWRGGCPWHESKSGTAFYIDTESLSWRCPACGIGGGPIQYLWKLQGGPGVSPHGEDFVKVLRQLAEIASVPFPERELTEKERQGAPPPGTPPAVRGTRPPSP